jgi:two-component system, chemotaxis family, response regulator Rcp1
MPDHIYQLLLVEDSQAEAHLFKEVLRTWAVRHLLSVVKDGWEAMAFLHHHGYFNDSPKPDLIFLDLAMPGLDGFETLRQIRSDPDIEVASIPVIVLTNSSAPSDVKRAYQAGANCYITKPTSLEQSYELMAAVEWFWFEINKLPPPSLARVRQANEHERAE